jgi:phosphomannomutase
VLTGIGVPVTVFAQHCPTPVLAFAVQHLGAAAGVMVTASHNPARDNGYKVYLGPGSGLDYLGSQIVPPVDGRIATLMNAVGSVADLPLGDDWVTVDESVVLAYISRTAATVTNPPREQLTVVHTAMHGIGTLPFREAASLAGFTKIHEVTEQSAPDPDFPTVAFPNPEEPGAMDLAFAHAMAIHADVIIAHDPDADRCAVALPEARACVERTSEHAKFAGANATQPAQQWQRLSGDDVGLLLGWWRLEQHRLGIRPLSDNAVFGSSVVSGSLLSRLCASRGVPHVRTLTGFKWLARVPNFAYGYEEALGYCVDPDAVHDKDGISASLAVLDCLTHLHTMGTTATELLAKLRDDLGGGVTHNISVTIGSPAAATAILRTCLQSPPHSIAGFSVIAVDDMNQGIDDLPPTSGVRWRLSASPQTPWRVIVRPSGTEPKVKCYAEAATAEDAESIAQACQQVIKDAEAG